jgi:mono/diheme cytochrome c family protein
MRYTRIGLASYAIASALVATVTVVAWARSQSMSEPQAGEHTRPAAPPVSEVQELDTAAYQAECAGCHGEGEARGRSIPALRGLAVELFTSEGGRDYLIDFMLQGRVRSVESGLVSYRESHPSYARLPDASVAAILNYVLMSWGNDALLPSERRLYAAADVAARRRER